MNFSTTICVLLFVLQMPRNASYKSDDLQEFERAVIKERHELEDLRKAIDDQGEELIKQTRSIDNLMEKFENAAENAEVKQMEKWMKSLSEPENDLHNIYFEAHNQNKDELNDLSNTNHYDVIPEISPCSKSCSGMPSNDEINMNKNDFSHEANYKLSKIEQESAGKTIIPSYRSLPMDYQSDLNPKRSSNFNPLNEVKLKTSSRLMAHGYGASLPSNALNDVHQQNTVDNVMREIERKYDDGIRLTDVSSNTDMNTYENFFNNDEHLDNVNGAYGHNFFDKYNNFPANQRMFDSRDKRLNEDKLLNQNDFEGNVNDKNNEELPSFQDNNQPVDNDALHTRSVQKFMSSIEPQICQKYYNMEDENGAGNFNQASAKDTAKNNLLSWQVQRNVDKREPEIIDEQHSCLEKEPEDSLGVEEVNLKEEYDANLDDADLESPDQNGHMETIHDRANAEHNDNDEDQANAEHNDIDEDQANAEHNDNDEEQANAEHKDNDQKQDNAEHVDNDQEQDNAEHVDNDEEPSDSAAISQQNNDSLNMIEAQAKRLAAYIQRQKSSKRGRRSKRSDMANDDLANDDHNENEEEQQFDIQKHKKEVSGKEQRNINLIIPVRNLLQNPPHYNEQKSKEINFNNLWFADRANKPNIMREKFNEYGNDAIYSNESYFFMPNGENLNFQLPTANNFNSLQPEEISFPDFQNPGCNSKTDHPGEECDLSSFDNSNQQQKSSKNNFLNNNLHELEKKVEKANQNSDNFPTKECQPEIIRIEPKVIPDSGEKAAEQNDKLIDKLKNQIMSCDNVDHLKEVFKFLQQKSSSDLSNSKADGTPSHPNSDISSCATCPTPEARNDLMKLNITIKARINKNPKDERQYSGDASIKVQPGLEEEGVNRETRSGDWEESADTPMNRLLNGKISSQVVQSVFDLVKESPKYNVLWPALKQNRVAGDQRFKNFYAIRNSRNEPVVRRAEGLVVRAMKCLNDIVEQEARQRACIPLRPDVSAFYELILETYQDMDQERRRRDTTSNLAENFSKQMRILDGNGIEERSCTVKKLLQQYEDLPKEDQQQMTGARDDLLKELMYLRKLKDQYNDSEREKRELLLEENDEAQRYIEDVQSNENAKSSETKE